MLMCRNSDKRRSAGSTASPPIDPVGVRSSNNAVSYVARPRTAPPPPPPTERSRRTLGATASRRTTFCLATCAACVNAAGRASAAPNAARRAARRCCGLRLPTRRSSPEASAVSNAGDSRCTRCAASAGARPRSGQRCASTSAAAEPAAAEPSPAAKRARGQRKFYA